MRKPGQGSIEEHPKGSERYRVRARVSGRLRTIARGIGRSEAEEIAAAYTVIRDEEVLREGITLGQFGEGFLERRKKRGIRSIGDDINRWKNYVLEMSLRSIRAPLGSLPISTIRRADVIDWLDALARLAPQTRRNALNLLRVALAEAVDRELLTMNPARDVRVKRAESATSEDELEGVLTPAEQQRLIRVVPVAAQPIIVFALVTGLRVSEQWWLRWENVQKQAIIVRYSKKGKPPKGGKPRVVELLDPARRVLELLPREREWVFPAVRGGKRPDSTPPKGWRKWVALANLGRHITWHDLRHTCATSLLAGWWGRKWSLDEVCQMLGHSSVTVTERYARKLNETLKLAVRETTFPERSHLMLQVQSQLGDLNPRPTVYESVVLSNKSQQLNPAKFPKGNASIEAHSPMLWSLAFAAERLGIGRREPIAIEALEALPRKRGRHA